MKAAQRFKVITVLTLSSCVLSACDRGSGSGEKPAAATAQPAEGQALAAKPAASDRDDALKLDPTAMDKLGIVVTPVAAAQFHPEATGYGLVIGRDAVIQALSEIEVARVRATQSHAALGRSRKLEGTPGADSGAEHESAIRQDAEDRSAVFLAQARMSSLLGERAARALGTERGLVDGLSAGRLKLVRATLPLGAVRGDTLPALRLQRMDAGAGDSGWRAQHVWPGPVESGMPGRTFLVLIDAPAVAEGERLMAYAATGQDEPLEGVLVPAAALVLASDDAWVYVEHDAGAFTRERLDTSRPLPSGYFVMGKFAPGMRVITAGASLLLSKELDVSPEDKD